MNEKRAYLIIGILYVLLSIQFNSKIIPSISDNNSFFMIPENVPLSMNNYLRVYVGSDGTWNTFLSQPSRGFDFLSYRLIFLIISVILNIPSLTSLLLFEKIVFSFLAFFGAFLLSKDYLSRFSKNKEFESLLIASFIGGLIYGSNPSFIMGDAFWMGIQFTYITLPWILLSFNKVVLDKNIKYAVVCALLLALNVDEHFLWAGFPILLGCYSGFIVIQKFINKRKIDVRPISNFLLVILIFIGMVAYRLIFRFATTSPYQLSLTKEGVDIPWVFSSTLNMLRAMTHMNIPDIYSTTHPIYSFFNALMPVTLLLPIIAFASFIYYKRNWVILFYGVLISLSILPFFSDSPLKWIHYWIFFNTPIGPAFRTWRISDAYIALSLTILITFSIYYLIKKVSNRRYLVGLLVSGLLFTIVIYSWPLLTGDVNGKLATVNFPNEYSEANLVISNQKDAARALFIPEFVYSSGSSSTLKPYWSDNVGAIQEFLTFSSANPTFLPVGRWGHFYDFTLSPFYSSLLKEGNVDVLAHFLSWANIKYILIHDDVPAMKENIRNNINVLSNSTKFKLLFHKKDIYVFENQFNEKTEKEIQIPPQVILIDGGYRVIKKLYDMNNYSNSNYNGFIFIDQKLSPELPNLSIITDKSNEQLTKDLILNKLSNQNSNYLLYPYKYVVEYSPQNAWSRASYLDPHQQVWHTYVNWQDYSWDFDFMKGVVFTINSNDTLEIPYSLEESGEYILLLRYFSNMRGGTVDVTIDNNVFELKTMNEYNGFLIYDRNINLEKNKGFIYLKNSDGFNALSTIALIPKKEYEILEAVSEESYSRNLIKIDKNVIDNPSFENNMVGWQIDDNDFKVSFDNSLFFDGTLSLKVSTNRTKTLYGWSWIKSNWINVSPEDKYSITTHMKIENANASHIVIKGYNESNGRTFQLTQVPSAQYGSFDWRIYVSNLLIPMNVTRIRIDLNAGWSNENGTTATTWFDSIKLTPLKSKDISLELPKINETPATVSNYTKINPTLYKVKVDASKPFMLSFAESYDPLWYARVDKINGTKVKSDMVRPVPLYSVINGFWINQTGDLDITIEYEPQKWFYVGAAISITTLIACIGYLVYDWRKSKNEGWTGWKN